MIPKEKKLFELFKDSHIIRGKFFEDVSIKKEGSKILRKEFYELTSLPFKTSKERYRIKDLSAKLHIPKEIDAICKTSECTWIFEVEGELNAMSIGQVIEYCYLYSKKHSNEKLKMGIICGKVKNRMFAKHLRKKYGIEAFLVDVKKNKAEWLR